MASSSAGRGSTKARPTGANNSQGADSLRGRGGACSSFGGSRRGEICVVGVIGIIGIIEVVFLRRGCCYGAAA